MAKGVDSQEIARLYKLLSLHGQTKDALSKSMGSWEYDIVAPYYKANMTDISAALGLVQLRRYPAMLSRRRALAAYYASALSSIGVDCLEHEGPGWKSSAHLFMAKPKNLSEKGRALLIEAMASSGVACNVHYKPLPLLTAYKDLGYSASECPNACALYRGEVTLPLYSTLKDEEAEYVAQVFARALAALHDGAC
jgi:dTDP-4-amino-4,6-dideoxygalactose transaminase